MHSSTTHRVEVVNITYDVNVHINVRNKPGFLHQIASARTHGNGHGNITGVSAW